MGLKAYPNILFLYKTWVEKLIDLKELPAEVGRERRRADKFFIVPVVELLYRVEPVFVFYRKGAHSKNRKRVKSSYRTTITARRARTTSV